MALNKTPIYITKNEAILAIRGSRDREEMEWAIQHIKATRVKRSRKLAHAVYKGRNQDEFCPHCKKSIDVFCLNKKVPRYVYCFWCGGAIERDFGPDNPYFDKTILEARDAKNN